MAKRKKKKERNDVSSAAAFFLLLKNVIKLKFNCKLFLLCVRFDFFRIGFPSNFTILSVFRFTGRLGIVLYIWYFVVHAVYFCVAINKYLRHAIYNRMRAVHRYTIRSMQTTIKDGLAFPKNVRCTFENENLIFPLLAICIFECVLRTGRSLSLCR